ncbi:hypothetical protein BB561_006174 [Smittium simulii]|uniref:Uncharacterized protein n=1 Tax=Smittium simulii TaxID=133385 RepID=A0A2T9Y633_9FUNG|nr:hypothetical protein BB561_006174 [Smittium simulii]
MSMFSPYSRSKPQQPEFLTDAQAEENSQKLSGLSYATQEDQQKDKEILTQAQEGVNDFLSSLDINQISSKVSPLASGIEYLNLEENLQSSSAALPSRGWSDDLCYGAGTAYLGGLAFGGAWGFIEGSRTPAKNIKIRINSLLNSMTRRGPFVGNSSGVLALYYNSLYSIIAATRDGKRDAYTSMSSAAITGALFKFPKGLKSSTKAAFACAAVMALYKASTDYEDFISNFNFKPESKNLKKACKSQFFLCQRLNQLIKAKALNSTQISKQPSDPAYRVISPNNWSSKKLLLTKIALKMALARCLLHASNPKNLQYISSLLFETWCDYFGFNCLHFEQILKKSDFSYYDITSISKFFAQNCPRKFKDNSDFSDAIDISNEIAGYLYHIDTTQVESVVFYDFWNTHSDSILQSKSSHLQDPLNEFTTNLPTSTLSPLIDSILSGKALAIFIYSIILDISTLRDTNADHSAKRLCLYNAYKYSWSFKNWMDCGFYIIRSNCNNSLIESTFLELYNQLLSANDLVGTKNLINITNLVKNNYKSKSLFGFFESFVNSLIINDLSFLQFNANLQWSSVYKEFLDLSQLDNPHLLKLANINESITRILQIYTVFTF